MKRLKDKPMRVSENLMKEFDEIKKIRALDVDSKHRKPISDARLSDGVVRCEEFKIIKKKLIKEPRLEDLR